jgi:hypothetical protein
MQKFNLIARWTRDMRSRQKRKKLRKKEMPKGHEGTDVLTGRATHGKDISKKRWQNMMLYLTTVVGKEHTEATSGASRAAPESA